MSSQEEKDPYSTYDLDDWQWEFLRRNPRYIKAYKAVEWLKKRLDKKKEQTGRNAVRFNAFGLQCTFTWIKHSRIDCYEGPLALDQPVVDIRLDTTAHEHGNPRNKYSYEGWQYWGSTYISGTRRVHRNDASGSFLDLPSPNDSSAHYKKLLKKHGAAGEIGLPGEDAWPVLEKYEIAVAIDTRYSIDAIINAVKDVVSGYQGNNRYHLELYSDYLRVWQRRKDKVSRSKIASSLWPRDYRDNKTAAIQKTRYYEQKFQELIDDSFPAKKRAPKSRNKPPSLVLPC